MSFRRGSPAPQAPLNVKKGSRCTCDGKVVRVLAIVSADEILVHNEAVDERFWVKVGDLSPLRTSKGSRRVTDTALLSPEEFEQARLWFDALRRLPSSGRAPWISRKAIADKFKTSVRTVDRRYARHLDNPVLGAQLNSRSGPAPGSRYLSPIAEAIIDKAYEDFYLRRERPKISQLHKEVVLKCTMAGIAEPPSYGSVLARVKSKDPLIAEKKRRGAVEGDAVQGVSLIGIKTERPLQIVQIDHALVDLIVVSPVSRLEIGRPWITLAIDVYTRCVIGWHVAFEVPDQTSVGLTIEQACFPKRAFLKELGIDIDYPVYGVMEQVHWDNGKSFQAKGIQRQCEARGIDTIVRPVRRPHWGQYIERYIGTFMGNVHMLPGTTFSNSNARGSYNSQKRAVMSLLELKKWIALEIVGKYANEPHKGIGNLSPMQKWGDSWKTSRGEVLLPKILSDRREFLLGFLPSKPRCVSRDGGISLFGLKYWDPAITPLINSGKRYDVHYRKDDLSCVWLRLGEQFIEVPLANRVAMHFSFRELKDAKKAEANATRSRRNETAWLEAIDEQRRLENEAAKTSRKARRSIEMRPPSSEGSLDKGAIDYTQSAPKVDLDQGRVK